MKLLGIDLRTLPAQLILSFVGLVVLTVAAIGLPAIWLIRDQLERQAWAQVGHGSRAAQALYTAQQSEINSLTTLTAQRPTLHHLLAQGDQASMIAYLRTLQTVAGLNLLLVCDSNQQAVAQAGVAVVFRDVSEEEAVHRLIGHFLANVAHEFRTPLSALAASVELLLDQAPDLSVGELQELLTSFHLGILGLQTLVDNLLESASIEAGRFRVNPRPSKLDKIIAEGIRMMQPLLNKRGQRLVVELPAAIPVVRADSRRTVQVLVNLLSNASKYGPDDAEIIVGATVSEGWVLVTVADRGPGIPPEYQNDVFRRFVYPDTNGDRTQYGAGLGLSVVKAVINAHGGQVGVEDRPGGGSVFWFTLPVESQG